MSERARTKNSTGSIPKILKQKFSKPCQQPCLAVSARQLALAFDRKQARRYKMKVVIARQLTSARIVRSISLQAWRFDSVILPSHGFLAQTISVADSLRTGLGVD